MRTILFEELPNSIGCHHIARTAVRAGQSTYVHTHDFPEVFLVEQGAGIHHFNGSQFALLPGALGLVAAHDVHHYECTHGEPLEFINLALMPAWLDAFITTLSPVPSPLPSLSTHLQLSAGEHEQCTQALRQLMSNGGTDPTQLPAAMVLVLRAVCRPHAQAVDAPPEWLARWRTALFSQRGVGQPLRYWQEQAGVSPEHLARSCRRHFGDSPSGLLVRARLEWACDQLRRDDVRIVDLAYDAGFDNLSYFYRCFRRAYGCTPLDWLARERAGAVPF